MLGGRGLLLLGLLGAEYPVSGGLHDDAPFLHPQGRAGLAEELCGGSRRRGDRAEELRGAGGHGWRCQGLFGWSFRRWGFLRARC